MDLDCFLGDSRKSAYVLLHVSLNQLNLLTRAKTVERLPIVLFVLGAQRARNENQKTRQCSITHVQTSLLFTPRALREIFFFSIKTVKDCRGRQIGLLHFVGAQTYFPVLSMLPALLPSSTSASPSEQGWASSSCCAMTLCQALWME